MFRFGIIHAHSDFSYDGHHPLEEIASFAKKRGYSFVGMTEHSDTFDEEKMSIFVNECRRLSDSEFQVVPGMEFTCEEGLHLIGLGVEQFTAVKDPIAVARFIRIQGGLSIVAHPSRYDYKLPSGIETEVHGIEVWNAAYDGRFVPNDRSIKIWQELRRCNKNLIPFGGQDLHIITGHEHVKLRVLSEDFSGESIIQSLKHGNFMIANSCFRLHPLHPPGRIRQAGITWTRRAYTLVKALRTRLGTHVD